jgi:hypothetical protein
MFRHRCVILWKLHVQNTSTFVFVTCRGWHLGAESCRSFLKFYIIDILFCALLVEYNRLHIRDIDFIHNFDYVMN